MLQYLLSYLGDGVTDVLALHVLPLVPDVVQEGIHLPQHLLLLL